MAGFCHDCMEKASDSSNTLYFYEWDNNYLDIGEYCDNCNERVTLNNWLDRR